MLRFGTGIKRAPQIVGTGSMSLIGEARLVFSSAAADVNDAGY